MSPLEGRRYWRRVEQLGYLKHVHFMVVSAILAVAVAMLGGSTPTTTKSVLTIQAPSATPATNKESHPITFVLANQLTTGLTYEVVGEVIVITLEGEHMELHSTSDDPLDMETVEASNPGSYSYAVDATMTQVDRYGEIRITSASGSGSVYIEDGVALAVFIHLSADGTIMRLSLQAIE